jgi:hypothetical protein
MVAMVQQIQVLAVAAAQTLVEQEVVTVVLV